MTEVGRECVDAPGKLVPETGKSVCMYSGNEGGGGKGLRDRGGAEAQAARTVVGTKFLPSLFLLGVARCGTTTLHSYLNDIPGICMSNPKEPYFFECEFSEGLDFYREKYFSHWRGERIIGESRHRNLYLPYVAKRIHQVNPNAKLVIMLRNPVERAHSHWWHLYCCGWERLQFREAIKTDLRRINAGLRLDTAAEIEEYCGSLGVLPSGCEGLGIYRTYLDSGYYSQQIDRYMEVFQKAQLKIVLFEELTSGPEETIEGIVDFLGLEPTTPLKLRARHVDRVGVPYLFRRDSKIHKIYNFLGIRSFLPETARQFGKRVVSATVKSTLMDRATREFLSDHYEEHNRALEKFIGRNLSHWR